VSVMAGLFRTPSICCARYPAPSVRSSVGS
jgi:hypothetical protein